MTILFPDEDIPASTASLEGVALYVMLATAGCFALLVAFFVGRFTWRKVKARKNRSAGY